MYSCMKNYITYLRIDLRQVSDKTINTFNFNDNKIIERIFVIEPLYNCFCALSIQR